MRWCCWEECSMPPTQRHMFDPRAENSATLCEIKNICVKEKIKKTMDEIKYLQETEQILRESVEGAKDELERRRIVDGVFRFVNYLESVQRMPLVTRQCLYGACYGVFNLLRRNRQLGRREGMFDAEVRNAIRSILSENLDDE